MFNKSELRVKDLYSLERNISLFFTSTNLKFMNDNKKGFGFELWTMIRYFESISTG